MKDDRGSWYLLTGLVLGLAIGLVFAWVIAPRTYGDTSPAFLRADFKDRYRAMIAMAFAANGNLPRAQARLNLLGDPDVILAVSDQAQRLRAGGSSSQEALALERLAEALRSQPTLLPAGQEGSESASPANGDPSQPFLAAQAQGLPAGVAPATGIVTTPIWTSSLPPSPSSPTSPALRPEVVTPTPLSPLSSTLVPQSSFVLQEQSLVCDQNLREPLIQVRTMDQAGRPVSGVEVVVRWEGGEDHFFTGLKPEMGLDYADFRMEPGTEYALQLALGGGQVSDLTATECDSDNGSPYWGSWLLVFTRP